MSRFVAPPIIAFLWHTFSGLKFALASSRLISGVYVLDRVDEF